VTIDLGRYHTLIFDCDGVVLDSNRVKTDAFYHAALPYGRHAAEALVEHHKQHGGISRHVKFRHFLQHVVEAPVEESALEVLLEAYAREVRAGLLTCRVNPELGRLREATAPARWMVVSGGDQDELRDVLTIRELTHLFDRGIFGGPLSKDAILAREKANASIRMPALYIGDSRYDHEAASQAGLDFLFLSKWTEFEDWRPYQRQMAFVAVPDLSSLWE